MNYLILHKYPKRRLFNVIGQLVSIAFIIIILSHKVWFLIPLISFVVYPFECGSFYFYKRINQQFLKNLSRQLLFNYVKKYFA